MLRLLAPPARRQSRRAPMLGLSAPPDVRLPPPPRAPDRRRARRLQRADARRDVAGEDGPGRVHRPRQDPAHLRAGAEGAALRAGGGGVLGGADRPLEDRGRRGGVMLLYLARHAQTASSAVDSFNGRGELPLTERGREQARKLGERLADVRFAAGGPPPPRRTPGNPGPLPPRGPPRGVGELTQSDHRAGGGPTPAQGRAQGPP